MSVTRSCAACAHFVPGSVMATAPTDCWDCDPLGPRRNFSPRDDAPEKKQVGGSHYATMKIQPWEYVKANHLDAYQKDIVKYVSRIKGDKAKRIEDLEKAIHVTQLYIAAIKAGEWPALGFVAKP